MTFGKFLPVALMVGVIASLWIIIGNYFSVAIWVPFISWAMYYILDPGATRPRRIPKQVLGLTGGILFGYLTIFSLPYAEALVGATFGLPLIVFVVATIIVLLEMTDTLELAPAYFFAYAGYFAYIWSGLGTPRGSLIPFWSLLMAGLLIGYGTAFFRRKILEGEGLYGPAQKTIFDKE